MTIREHESVVLTRDLPEQKLRAGDVGAVVHIYGAGQAYEVEFVSGSGQTLALATLEPRDVRQLGAGDILHARSVAAA